MFYGMIRNGYIFADDVYHPECLPVNRDPGFMHVIPIFTREDLDGRQATCRKCRRSIFPRKGKQQEV